MKANSHFEAANSLFSSEPALVEATLALAYEQRTANLIATLAQASDNDLIISLGREIFKRLDRDPDEIMPDNYSG